MLNNFCSVNCVDFKNANKNLKTLNDYSTLINRKGVDPAGRVYLTLRENHLGLTGDKTEKMSKNLLGSHVEMLLKDIDRDQKLNGTTQEKKILRRALSEIVGVIDLDRKLARLFKSQTTPIRVDSPFYGTDLIVFKDTYAGALPLNGIRQAEFDGISDQMSALKAKKKCGSIEISSVEDHLEKILGMFILLYQRKIGRDLLKDLIFQEKEIEIFIIDYPNCYCEPSENKVKISINPEVFFQFQVSKGGKEYFEDAPYFLTLAHELIHASHGILNLGNFIKQVETAYPSYTNAEEYHTITGWNPSEDNLKDSPWDPQSENGLRSVFGFLPRVNHRYKFLFVSEKLEREGEKLLNNLFLKMGVNTIQLQELCQERPDRQLSPAVSFNKTRVTMKLIECGAKEYIKIVRPGFSGFRIKIMRGMQILKNSIIKAFSHIRNKLFIFMRYNDIF